MLLGFKRRFAPFVCEGSKTHTIRGIRRNVPKAGETCHCYVDPRQKSMKLLGRWPCVRVEEVVITPEHIEVAGIALSRDERNDLAWRDGFREPRGVDEPFDQMLEFWRGRLPFYGHLIHWDYTRSVTR
jgi:hypothetical protein